MAEELISMYIDDELDFDDKIVFVEKIHGSSRFKNTAVELLWQEKQLRNPPTDRVPEIVLPDPTMAAKGGRRRWDLVAGALAAAVLVFLMIRVPGPTPPVPPKVTHRFVVYLPDATTAAIAGSFNDWQALPMLKAGTEGYWEIFLDLKPGEYRYSFILDGGRWVADPTVRGREKDDFGTENSVLEVRV